MLEFGLNSSTRLPADKLIWAETNNGLFTVKSAYKVAVDILAASPLGSSGSSSDKSNMTRFLKCVWKLDVPHKIRHFVWRACRDILPTKRILKHQQILVEDICDECKLESETTGNVFWSCPRAQNIWKMMMLDDCEENILALVVTIAWSIWTNCNEVRNGGKKKGELELLQWSCQYLQEYVGAKKLSIKAVQDQIEHWCPPPENMYKVNVDGTVFSAKKEAGIGIVARDCHGLVIAAMSMKVSAPLGPLEVEAKAFEAGLQFAKDLGIQDFILEGDSLNVYRALVGLSHAAVVVAPIIYGILDS